MKTLLLTAVLAFAALATAKPLEGGDNPLFTATNRVRVLQDESFEAMLQDTETVWLVDYYAPWCPHCRQFAPQWEQVATFYADTHNVRVGSVDCTQNSEFCNREQIYGYPSIKIHHVPASAAESIKMSIKGRKNTKTVIGWAEDLMEEHGIKSGVSGKEIDEQFDLFGTDPIEELCTTKEACADETSDPADTEPFYPDDSMEMKYNRLRDAGAAAVFTLENSFYVGTTVLEGERYDAALRWVEALAACFPMEGNRAAFTVLANEMKHSERWEQGEWAKLVANWKEVAKTMSFPVNEFVSSEDDGWAYCTTYTCGLWTLFHTMTVSDIKTTSLVEPWKPSEIMAAIRLFVKYFFGCEECQRHFMMANPVEKIHELAIYDVQGPRAVALWVWLMHNKVNKVLKHEQWPAAEDCPVCYVDNDEPISLNPALLNEDEIVGYLSSVFGHDDHEAFSLDAAREGMDTAAFRASLQSFNPTVVGATGGVVLIGLLLLRMAFRTPKELTANLKKVM